MKYLQIAALLIVSSLCLSWANLAGAENPKIEFDTSKGKIVLELYADKAPATVKNFLGYIEANFYDGTIFHRVIPGFMIQGGGFTADMQQKKTRAAVKNEADNKVKNERGSVAMARTRDPHSATAQFFINIGDNDFLNFTAKTAKGWGYTVFGRVTEGMEAVDAIVKVKTGNRGRFQNVPAEAVIIKTARRLDKQ